MLKLRSKLWRSKMRNGLTILFILFIVSVVCEYILISHLDPISQSKILPFHGTDHIKLNTHASLLTSSTVELARELLIIYEQQLSRLADAPFLPTYENHRLRFKVNITSIATYLYGAIDSFNGSSRHLRVVCLNNFCNTTTLHEVLSFNLSFVVKTSHTQQIHLTLEHDALATYSLIKSSIPEADKQDDTVHMEVNGTFPIDAVFRFTYQWTDSDIVKSFNWPEWPLQQACMDSIEHRIQQNRETYSQPDFPCLATSTLNHSTSREMFIAEQTAVIYWLNKQYDATIPYPFPNESRLKQPLPSKTKARRLSPLELSLNSTICSPEFNTWISMYQQWHENITTSISHLSMSFKQQRDRILDTNIRFMLYKKPTSGTADRLVHLMTTYLIAVLTQRLFLFDSNWPDFFDVIQSTLNYEQRSVIPWFSHLHILNANLSQNDSKYLTSRSHVTSFDNIDQHYDYDREFPERILLFQGHMGRIVPMMTSNRSIYRNFLTDDLHMNPENMFGCLYHSLLIHRLAALVKRTSKTIDAVSASNNLGHSSQQILRTLLSSVFFPIGIQVRTDDDLTDYNMGNQSQAAKKENIFTVLFQNHLTCARDIAVRNQEFLDSHGQLPIGFLLSNAVGVRQTFLKRWQLPPYCFHSFGKGCYTETHQFYILASPDPVFHVADTSQSALAFQLAMFDIFLFGFCERHIISTISGFGRVAVFASLKQQNIYSLSRDESPYCRNDSEAISLIDSAYDWSGI